MSAIQATREVLDKCGMTGKDSLVASDSVPTGVDAAGCLALGARMLL